jgi:hypothetical protein
MEGPYGLFFLNNQTFFEDPKAIRGRGVADLM